MDSHGVEVVRKKKNHSKFLQVFDVLVVSVKLHIKTVEYRDVTLCEAFYLIKFVYKLQGNHLELRTGRSSHLVFLLFDLLILNPRSWSCL